MVHLLLVDDDLNQRDLNRQIFEIFGYQVTTAGSGQEALHVLERETVDLIITDWNMPDQNGIDLSMTIRARWPAPPIILLTGYAVEDAERQAAGSGITTVLGKPILPDELDRIVKQVLARDA